MVRVCVSTPGRSYNPDAEAYRQYFEGLGYECEITSGRRDFRSCDVAILVNGFNPFWRRYPLLVIEEYQSMSVGRFRRVKDVVKFALNKRGDFVVVLNEFVKSQLLFRNNAHFLHRPMGYFDIEPGLSKNKQFDLVYAGSEREGLRQHIERLARLNLKILLVGRFAQFGGPNVTVVPPVSPTKVAYYLDQAAVGLNFVPNQTPLIFQDSTKVIEYCARGLGVLSNRYPWIEDFFRLRGGKYMPLETAVTSARVKQFQFVVPDVQDLSWPRVIADSGLIEAIESGRAGSGLARRQFKTSNSFGA